MLLLLLEVHHLAQQLLDLYSSSRRVMGQTSSSRAVHKVKGWWLLQPPTGLGRWMQP
jgi:hypothetical protein